MGLVPIKKVKFSIGEIRDAKPQQVPAVTFSALEDGGILLVAPGAKGFMGLGNRERKIELEPVGAKVWELCDGKRTVRAIASELCTLYKMNRVEAETALVAFLNSLASRGLIVFAISKKGKK